MREQGRRSRAGAVERSRRRRASTEPSRAGAVVDRPTRRPRRPARPPSTEPPHPPPTDGAVAPSRRRSRPPSTTISATEPRLARRRRCSSRRQCVGVVRGRRMAVEVDRGTAAWWVSCEAWCRDADTPHAPPPQSTNSSPSGAVVGRRPPRPARRPAARPARRPASPVAPSRRVAVVGRPSRSSSVPPEPSTTISATEPPTEPRRRRSQRRSPPPRRRSLRRSGREREPSNGAGVGRLAGRRRRTPRREHCGQKPICIPVSDTTPPATPVSTLFFPVFRPSERAE